MQEGIMFEKLKEMKLNITFTAVLMIVFGIILLIWPGQVSAMIGKVVGLLLIITGVVQILGKIMDESNRAMGLTVSIIILLFGLYIFINPSIVVELLPIIFGILLVVHGVQDVSMAFEGRVVHATRWGGMIALGVVDIVLGLFCIANAFGLVKMTFMLIGLMLIYDGIKDMVIVHRVNRATRTVDSTILHEEDVDDYQ